MTTSTLDHPVRACSLVFVVFLLVLQFQPHSKIIFTRTLLVEPQTEPEVPLTNSSYTAPTRVNATDFNYTTPSNNQEYFSACLLIMDDNHFLIEWLAYHYHVLPLRRLIVHVDPDSKTSPEPILKRWKDRMEITLWDHQNNSTMANAPVGHSKRQHRVRQQIFLRNCMTTLKEEDRGWTLFSDTDEYTLINPRYRDSFYLKNLYNTSQRQPGSVLTFLPHAHYNKPCVSITRRNFGTREIPQDISNTFPLTDINASQFQTFRWRHHAFKHPVGKMMMDLSQIDNATLMANIGHENPHIPIPKVCAKGAEWFPESKNVFAIYHYSGTLEQILFRNNDKRGSDRGGNGTAYRMERYHDTKKPDNNRVQAPDTIHQWLDGFVQQVGLEEAQRLLQHVGKPQEASE